MVDRNRVMVFDVSDQALDRVTGFEAFAVLGGADMIRTHDVGAAVEAARMGEAVRRGSVGP